MTGFMHEKQFSRKSFVKGGGALVVGYSAIGVVGNASAASGNTPFSKRVGGDFLPDLNNVDSWIAVTADNKVIVTHGETEQGHGTPTGILQLVAEEMDMSMDQMVYAHPESWLNATGGGGGSNGVGSRSTQCRAAAAYARQLLLGMAATKLGTTVDKLTVTAGVVSGGSGTVKYGDLMGGKNFNYVMPLGNPASTSATATQFTAGTGITKPVSSYKVVGKSFARIDIPAKVNATYTYSQNVHIAGMLHARSVRPRGAGANASVNNQPVSVDAKSIAHIPGAQVVQIKNFVAVVAPKEYDAIQAASQLKVVWKSDPKFGDGGSGNYWAWMRKAADVNTANPARWTADTGAVPAALAGAAKTVSATYKHHYNGFVPIGPHCAVADVKATTATIWQSAQALQAIPGNIAGVLNANNPSFPNDPKAVRVIFFEGASSFGGGMWAEPAEIAALVSQTIGKPVRLQFMRWDQHGWDSYGPSHMYDVKMATDASGKIVAADWTAYGQAGTTIDTTKELVGTATWPAVPGSGGPTPSDAAVYNIAQRRVLAKTQPLYGGALKISALRAPNAPQSYFASEQIVDEMAYAAGMDPVAFRRLNIDKSTTLGSRWISVMDAVTIASGWQPRVANSVKQTGDVVKGRGFSFGTFASSQTGVIADVEVNKRTGKILVKHMYVSQNNGITVSPQLVANQMSGATIQGVSRALWEAPTWNKERVTSLDWVTYPILRFKDSPTLTLINSHPGKHTTVVPNPTSGDVSSGNIEAFNLGWLQTGSGEPPTTACASSIANAFFDATGVRIRQAPMTPAVVRGVLKNAGVA